MNICVIGNFSDKRCGFQNFSHQTVRALVNAGHEVLAYDGTYSEVYARREAGKESFLPPQAEDFDVLHVIWHPATLNHYSGATWPDKPVKSVWNGCPAAWCPFNEAMDIKWGVLGTEEGHEQLWYPIPDWVQDLPHPNEEFTIGYSGVRGDGLALLSEVCKDHGWRTNFSDPTVWLSQEDEIRRLARSTVNVCWQGAEHDDRSGSAMVCLASRRPLLINDVRMMTHLKPFPNEVYIQPDDPGELDGGLEQIYAAWRQGAPLRKLEWILGDLSWTSAVMLLEDGWQHIRGTRG